MAGIGGGRRHGTARVAAVAALVRVHRGGWANMAAGALAQLGLDERDRAFAGAVFFGTVERLISLDFLLAPFLKRPLERLDVEVRAVLECGLYQLLYMRVPPSAAVNESVKLARAMGKTSASGLVNAVLRRCAEHTSAGENGPDWTRFSFEDERQRVGVVHSVSKAVAAAVMEALPRGCRHEFNDASSRQNIPHPCVAVSRNTPSIPPSSALGCENFVRKSDAFHLVSTPSIAYDAFFESSFSTGELCLRVNTLRNTTRELAEMLAQKGGTVRSGGLPQALYARLPGGVETDEAFAQGLYHVQGLASQVACACVRAAPGQRVLDVCAAPGGKSASLAQQMGGGAGLTACDIRPHRLELIRQLFARLGIEGARVQRGDATVYNEALCGQDAVLCDVPCSGLGVLAQKPDLRMSDGAGFEALPELQLKILRTSARYVKKGGRLVYATCTVRPQENTDVVRSFLAEKDDFAPVAPPVVPEGAVLEDGMMTLLPHRTGTDGFFIATLERL